MKNPKFTWLYMTIAVFFSGIGNATSSSDPSPTVTPYLLSDAPTFDLTLEQFRQQFNHAHPALRIAAYHPINVQNGSSSLLRAASKINQQLYSSAAIDKGSHKIKSLQLTFIPLHGEMEKVSREKAVDYMSAFMCWFDVGLSTKQCQHKVQTLLTKGKTSALYQETEGALRYVVVNNGEKGITFAIEPIKLSLSAGT